MPPSVSRCPRALVLDLDGLLLNSEQVYRRAWTESGAALGFTIATDFYDSVIGIPNEDSERMLCSIFGPAFPLKKFADSWRRRFLEIAATEGIAPKPGLHELIATIRQFHLSTAVATSSTRREIGQNQSARDLVESFNAVVTSDDITHSKPDPEIFTAAVARLGIAASQAVALEDSNNGMRSAMAAGLRAIMVPDIVGPDKDVRQNALAVVPTLAEAAEIIRNLCLSASNR